MKKNTNSIKIIFNKDYSFELVHPMQNIQFLFLPIFRPFPNILNLLQFILAQLKMRFPSLHINFNSNNTLHNELNVLFSGIFKSPFGANRIFEYLYLFSENFVKLCIGNALNCSSKLGGYVVPCRDNIV